LDPPLNCGNRETAFAIIRETEFSVRLSVRRWQLLFLSAYSIKMI